MAAETGSVAGAVGRRGGLYKGVAEAERASHLSPPVTPARRASELARVRERRVILLAETGGKTGQDWNGGYLFFCRGIFIPVLFFGDLGRGGWMG